MIDYKKLNIKPNTTIHKAFTAIIAQCEPELDIRGINKIYEITLKDRECRIAMFMIVMKALEANKEELR